MKTATKKIYKWKFLFGDKSANGNHTWNGKWCQVDGDLSLCSNGFHASDKILQALRYVNGDTLAKVECRGEHLDDNDKSCWREMRVVERYPVSKETWVEFAIYAAELVIDIYEKKYPKDDRPRKAIEAARAYLKAKDKSAAAYAADAADAAAYAARAADAAAYAAAYAAADAAADAAAYAAADAAAYDAAYAAAYAALRKKLEAWLMENIVKKGVVGK